MTENFLHTEGIFYKSLKTKEFFGFLANFWRIAIDFLHGGEKAKSFVFNNLQIGQRIAVGVGGWKRQKSGKLQTAVNIYLASLTMNQKITKIENYQGTQLVQLACGHTLVNNAIGNFWTVAYCITCGK